MQSYELTRKEMENAVNQKKNAARFLHDFRTDSARFVLFFPKSRFVRKRRIRARKVRLSYGFNLLIYTHIQYIQVLSVRSHDFFPIFCKVGVRIIRKRIAHELKILYICISINHLTMTTTRINLPPHLCEYLRGKYGDFAEKPIRLPDHTDIYHIIFDLLERRPVSQPVDRGNLELVLPERSVGKRPETYNYLGVRSQRIIVRKIETMMWAEVHDHIDRMKHCEGMDYKDAVHLFICRYGIESLSEDAFLKNYYRWRGKMKRTAKKCKN